MNIYEKMGDTIIVYMPREVDDYAAVKMTAGIDGVFAEEVVRHAIFDFGRTTFMDSSGIGLIMGRTKLMGECGGRVEVRSPQPYIKRVLRLSGIERIVKIT